MPEKSMKAIPGRETDVHSEKKKRARVARHEKLLWELSSN
jgi:hypothetical protein